MHDYDGIPVSNKEMAIMVLVCVVSLAVIYGAGYLLGLSHGKDVHDNGDGVKPISTELGQVGTNITDAKDGINQAQGTAGEISSTIKDAAGTVDYIGATADNSTDIIRQSKSIIARIRQRGEAQKTKD